MSSKKRNLLIVSTVLIIIGCIGTFAKEAGIYTAAFALGIVFLILGSATKH